MGATKIINILRDDTFDEIYDIFQNATAEEVIFVLPKRSKTFSKETHFAALAKIAKTSGKKISLLTSNPQAIAMGRAYNFEVLPNEPSSTRKKSTKSKKAELTALRKTDIEEEFEDVRDDRDAFERDVVVPSDEIVVTEEEEGEKENKEEVEPEEERKEERSSVSDEDDEIQEPKEEDLQNKEDEELVRSNIRSNYRVVPVSYKKVPPSSSKPIHLKKEVPSAGFATEKQLNDIERVWKDEVSAPGANIWSEPMPPRKKSGFLRNIFSRREPTIQAAPISSNRRSHKAIWGVLMLALLVFGGIIFISSGSAKVLIKPTEKKLDFSMQISTSDRYAAVDSTFNKLPGQLFTVNKIVSRTFPASGKKEVAQKARGKITIYNEYGTNSQTLIATTRFATSEGLVFRTLRTVSVPGAVIENGKTTPGQMEVEVIAEKPGQTYNIPANKFSILAFKERADTARYEKIYGRSIQPFTGGISGTAQVVTELDFSTAQDTIKEELRKEIEKALADETHDLLIPKIPEITITKIESTAQVDEAADNFTLNAIGSVKTVGFKKSDLDGLLSQHIGKNYNLIFLSDRININYKEISFDDARSALDMSVSIAGNGYMKLDEQKILQDLLGKSEENIRDYLRGTIGIASAKVVLSPFWVNKMPSNKEKIKFEVAY